MASAGGATPAFFFFAFPSFSKLPGARQFREMREGAFMKGLMGLASIPGGFRAARVF